MPLPRSERGHEVVEVHEDVDECVEEAEEGGVPAGDEAGARPHRHRHDAVVDHVEEAHVGELLAGHEAELKWKKRQLSIEKQFLSKYLSGTILKHL